VARTEKPFLRDPNLLDRALTAHVNLQNGLSDYLNARGAATWSPGPGEPDYDLAWELGGVRFVAEVKSLTASNEDRQLRLGLGQVLDYQQLMHSTDPLVLAVLVIEREPASDRWLALCARHGVALTWPDRFGLLVRDGECSREPNDA
jgi:hypothetical protein